MQATDAFGELPRIDVTPARSLAARGRAIMALALIAVADVVLRAGGFERFTRLVRRWPVRRPARPANRDAVVRETCLAVDRATAHYVFRHARCLQRAAATVCCLRLAGQPARLVIGVRKIPFAAHAWAEIDGVVVNGPSRLRAWYAVIEEL